MGRGQKKRPAIQPPPNQPPTPPPNPPAPQAGYLPDIAALRGMPQDLIDAYKRHIALLGQNPAFLQDFQKDISYLRGIPGQGEFEQSVLTTRDQDIDRIYDAAMKRRTMEAGARGLEPSSGNIQEQMLDIENERARQKSEARNQLAMWRLGEMRSRLGEARQVAGGLDTYLTGRSGMGLGTTRELVDYDLARRAQARQVEGGLEQAQRQRLMDLFGFLQGGQPSSTPAQLAQNWALAQSQLAGNAGGAFGNTLGNLGSSAMYYYMLMNPDIFSGWFGNG